MSFNTVQKFVVCKIFFDVFEMFLMLNLFDQSYSKIYNIVNYSYNLK